jgi:hypothetical protein
VAIAPKVITISVVTRLQDNGDGGYTLWVYNNYDELIADHPKSRRWDSTLKKDVPVELTQKERDDILKEDDPYENGYIGSDKIKVVKVGKGYQLAEPLSFHSGQ